MQKFNSAEKILQYIKSKDKKTRIIGLFLRAKGTVLENKEQLNRIYKRYVKSAKELDCYSDKRIIATMKYLLDKADFKWTIESIAKYIDEDFEQLKGKTPIIILKNGTKIYDTSTLKNLERSGCIYYQKDRWHER